MNKPFVKHATRDSLGERLRYWRETAGEKPMESVIQKIPLGKINLTNDQRPLRNLRELTASIQRLGLLQPILVAPRGPRYRLLDGWRRYHACDRLGWSEIPAIVLSVDDQIGELIRLDANLVREELTPSVRVALLDLRSAILGTTLLRNKHPNTPRQAHPKKKQQAGNAPAANTPSKKRRTPRTMQPPVFINTDGFF
jgi:hypothetical protein